MKEELHEKQTFLEHHRLYNSIICHAGLYPALYYRPAYPGI